MEGSLESSRDDIKLGYYISLLSLLFHSVLLSSCLVLSFNSSEGTSFPANFGLLLSSYPGLFCTLLASIVSVLLSKRLIVKGAPKAALGSRGNNKCKSVESSTFLQRSVRRFKRFIIVLRPVKALLKGLSQVLCLWGLGSLLVFCLGANIFNLSTWRFSLLLTILSLKPILLGQDITFFQNYSEGKAEPHWQALLQHSLGAFLGAWLGAFPIPLDWDRDWQDWPITCVIGAHLGAYVSYALTSYKLSGKDSRKTKDSQKWKKLA